MIRMLVVASLLAISLAGCTGPAPQGAAESASRLLAAATKGDRVAFEAEIDRPAVRDDVRNGYVSAKAAHDEYGIATE